MAIAPAVVALLGLGAALFIAFLASGIFRRIHVPDIVFLLLTGAVLGPVLGVLDRGTVDQGLPILAALAIITILFDGALEVRPAQLKDHGVHSLGLSFAIATTTTLLAGLVGHRLAGLPWPSALLLGLCFGGAGIAIIVPLARRMSLSPGATTVVLLEAVTSDIFVIMGMFVGGTIVASGALGIGLTKTLVLLLVLGAAAGAAFGWLWSRFLERWGEASNAYTATLAALLIVYALSEALGGSGALAVLLFGLIVGNARDHPAKGGLRRPVLPGQLIEFHHEIVFFVRAAFFVLVGAAARWDLLRDPKVLATGLLLSVVVALCRGLGVLFVLRRSGLPRWDRVGIAVLFPMGLATAAVAVLPRQFGLVGGDLIVDYAAVVIVLTNILGTLAVFVVSSVRKRAMAKADAGAAA